MPSETPPAEEGGADAAAAPPLPFLRGRLHPWTLVFAVWDALRGLVVPAIVVLVMGSRSPAGGLFLLFVAALPIAAALARYFTFRYRIEAGELVTEQGLFGRTERHIPLARVQDIRLEQGLLHRLLGMADVHVETGSGQGAEASLSVLSRAEAERLRRAVFAGTPERLAAGGEAGAAAPAAGETIWKISPKELMLAGLTSNHLVSALAVVFGLIAFVMDVLPRDFYGRYLKTAVTAVLLWWERAGDLAWVFGVMAAALLALLGMLLSVAGTVALFYGFRLALRGEDLYREYGLLTRRAGSLPRRRIQVLKVEESLLRRRLGLAALRADTAGSAAQGERTGRDVLLPVVPAAAVEGLLPSFFPDLDPAPPRWHRVAKVAIRRGTAKGLWGCALLAVATFALRRDLTALWPLALAPLAYAISVAAYGGLGYALGPRYFRTRRGWLGRATHVVPIRNVQAVVVRQTPFDRRLGVATLIVDTAGQAYTGGGPRIDNLPWGEALDLARTITRRAASLRYRW